ncbi:archaemetzincin [Chitinophaga sancti]|uniref:Archaemetzincin n=2 Tax=Chitinophaga sancti TaxID=1004 RepID=A0A1K1RB09_9BACT|nr:archaemetzincin [Chitinophaga sancti]WQG88831.1 archaemetzincin [Chitinophaga sancti]SFW69113.1 archaemetzincin [Chitinophaga sancti]
MKYLAFIFITCLLFSCHSQKQDPEMAHLASLAKNDIPLPPPEYGDWLYRHKERGQNLAAYQATKPISSATTIYLLPVGDFTASQTRAFQDASAYIAIFFQRKTVLLHPIPDSEFTSRIFEGHRQLLAPYILDSVLLSKRPANNLAMMALSAKDLYPQDDWNYVFGLGSYGKRVGVTSIYRLQEKNFLRRLVSISSHEIGHMLSLHHCIHALCVMNGTNGLYETDRAPLRLCAECQQKLFWNLKYDNQKRLQELMAYCKENGFQKDWEIFNKDNNQNE